MKKLLSLLLCVAMIMGCTATAAYAADDLTVLVANDLHLSLKSYTPYTGNTQTNPWSHVPTSGQLIRESNAIITAFLDNAANSSAKAILLPGDLVDTGVEEEHVLMAAKLAEFEAATGKQVYVVPGNHDLFKTDSAAFEAIYADFGYNQAVAEDDNSAAYVADIDDTYRLIAIDSTLPGGSVADMTPEKIEWIAAQLAQAKADGKYVIAMMHHNLLEHFIFGSQIHAGAIVADASFKDTLADNGVKFIFTGHTHDQDIASYTSSNGNVIYDVVTNSINGYPCQYRQVTFAKDVKFETKTVSKVDAELIPAGLSEEAMSLLTSDFTAYTKKVMWTGLRTNFTGYLNASSLITLLKLSEETDPDMCRIIRSLGDKLEEIVQMPFYTADENGKSMQAVAAEYGKTLPASNYTDLIDLAITLYQAHCTGDENYPANSTEVQLLLNAVSTVLCYCLEDISAEDYTLVLKFVLTLTGASATDDILNFAGNTMERVKGIDMVASLVLRPLVTEFTTDDSPADNNVTLTGYGKVSAFEQFVQKIKSFFDKIAEFFRMLFSFAG